MVKLEKELEDFFTGFFEILVEISKAFLGLAHVFSEAYSKAWNNLTDDEKLKIIALMEAMKE